MKNWTLPGDVEAVFSSFLTSEFATVGASGHPVAWPVLPTYWPARGQFVVASPVALAQKAANARRNPRVSLLYSNPTGSGLDHPPAVLVQGQASVMDRVLTDLHDLDPDLLEVLGVQGQRLFRTQPGMRLYLANPLTRYVMEWYFIRLFIFVTPYRFTWWPASDFEAPPITLEVPDVEPAFALPA